MTLLTTILLLATVAFSDTKMLTVQICLEREGYSPNIIDGSWGRKSQRALETFCHDNILDVPASPEAAHDAYFAGTRNHLFRVDTVTAAELASLVQIPDAPAARAQLSHMGYTHIAEMYAERGHLTERALQRLNPNVDFNRVTAGTPILIPDFGSMKTDLAAWPRNHAHGLNYPDAALVKVSLGNFEISAYDRNGRLLALYPCSIAKNRTKLPARRELKIVTHIANPNYTYTPDKTPANGKAARYVWPAGPNCPVGVAWLGLDLPGYGIHGTPRPESIGNAESHGCFRLSNWNAARLYALCPVGTRVIITD